MTKGTTKSNGQKHELDKFYTVPELAKELIKLTDISKYHVIIEPSAGGGSFSQWLPNVLAYDIEPEYTGIKQQDYLELTYEQVLRDYRDKYPDSELPVSPKILVIGNPPFGTAGSLALEFISHSYNEIQADTVAFILPLSFAKDSNMDRLPQRLHLVTSTQPGVDTIQQTSRGYILEESSFTLNRETYAVPCVYQIWHRKDELRPRSKRVSRTEYFTFTTPEESELRIQRVGGNAGRAVNDKTASFRSNYYIQLTNKTKQLYTTQEFIEMVNGIIFPTVHLTTGPRSLSKTELITEIEKRIHEQVNTKIEQTPDYNNRESFRTGCERRHLLAGV